MLLHSHYLVFLSFYFFIYKNTPGGSEVKVSACNVGDLSSIPGLGRSPGEGNGKTLQYSSPENPMDRGAWWATVHGVAKGQTRLSGSHHHHNNKCVTKFYSSVLKTALLLVPFYRCKNCCSEKWIAQGHTVSVPFLCQCVLSSMSHLCPSALQGRKLHVPGSLDEDSW